MTAQRFSLPNSIGAANVQVFSPDGSPLMKQWLATPGDVLQFDARVDGVFQIRIAPVGEPAFLTPVEVDSSRSEDLSNALNRRQDRRSPARLRRVDLTTSRHSQKATEEPPTVRPDSPRKSASRDLASVDRSELAYFVPMEDNRVAYSRAYRLAVPEATPAFDLDIRSPSLKPIRRVAVGVSLDEQPFRDGGWRPFDGPWEIFEGDQDSRWTFDIVRDLNDPPLTARNARCRVHLAVEQTRVLRLLLPLFVGGVRLTIDAQNGDVGIWVRPIDPTLHILMQALDTGSEADPLVLFDHVATTSSPGLLDDPWAAAVFGLLAHRIHPDAFTVQDAIKLADQCPWLADASIIAASLILAGEDPDVALALRHLSHARKVGAPYFTVSNEMLGDLLVILAADAKDVDDRATAQRELRLWRKRLPFQSAAGPYFAWVTRGGARNRGHIDARYVRTLYQGLVVRGSSGELELKPELEWDGEPLLDLSS